MCISVFFVTFWLLTLDFFFRLFFSLDTSTTMVVQPGPVINFLLANQNVNHPNYLDWNKVHHLILCCSILADVLLSLRSVLNYLTFPHQARRALKNLRVKVSPSNREYKITGLSEERCKYQMYVVI